MRVPSGRNTHFQEVVVMKEGGCPQKRSSNFLSGRIQMHSCRNVVRQWIKIQANDLLQECFYVCSLRSCKKGALSESKSFAPKIKDIWKKNVRLINCLLNIRFCSLIASTKNMSAYWNRMY